jgi:hypothetical protein
MSNPATGQRTGRVFPATPVRAHLVRGVRSMNQDGLKNRNNPPADPFIALIKALVKAENLIEVFNERGDVEMVDSASSIMDDLRSAQDGFLEKDRELERLRKDSVGAGPAKTSICENPLEMELQKRKIARIAQLKAQESETLHAILAILLKALKDRPDTVDFVLRVIKGDVPDDHEDKHKA